MIFSLDILLTLISGMLAVPALVLFVEVVSALLYRQKTVQFLGTRPKVAVLMPAHNEAFGIRESLQTLLPQLLQNDRLVVIADNCSDDTAKLATTSGAEVIQRHDPARRGKGFALHFGVRHLEHDPPEVVIVADADCAFPPGSIDRLAMECQQIGRPVQALYLMRTPEGAGTRDRIALFAWTVKNQVRPTGLMALALPCHLMGTGMAFPWLCICSAQLATGHIVEDMQLGLDLAIQGEPPHFCPSVIVTSTFPQAEDGIRSQRTRWEHGHLGVILTQAPRLLLNGLGKLDVRTIALAMDLLVPPLALFAILVSINIVLDASFALVHGGVAPFILAAATLALFGLSVLLAWLRHGRHIISLYALASAPAYALWKLPIYVRFLLSRQLDWVRSKRDP